MRLQANDLISYARVMWENTKKLYEIIPTKDKWGYWRLDIRNNENWASELLAGWLTLREAHEALRAVYATYRFLIGF